ncbi:MAG: hypothetical protein ACKOA5_15755, partial [Actinomycetota bacterium]
MNTNRITNKNTKRFAIAAGATAAVLFLGAGLVASRGGESNNANAVEALLAVVPAPVIDEVAEIVEQFVAEIPVAQSPAPKQEVMAPKSSVKSSVKSTKAKKSPTLSGGIVYGGPEATEVVTTPDTSVAPAPQQDDNTAVATPAEQPAVEQPAVQQPAADQTAAVASDAPAAQQPTASTSTSNTSTWLNIPKIIGEVSFDKSVLVMVEVRLGVPMIFGML